MIQLRAKDHSEEPVRPLAERIRQITVDANSLFIVNRMPTLAAEFADGIHVGADSELIRNSKDKLGEDLLVGASCHSAKGIHESVEAGADYLILGPAFPTRSHLGAQGMGIEEFARIVSESPVPVIGIGGITNENAGEVIRAGAAGIAVIGTIAEADDPSRATRLLIQSLIQARPSPDDE